MSINLHINSINLRNCVFGYLLVSQLLSFLMKLFLLWHTIVIQFIQYRQYVTFCSIPSNVNGLLFDYFLVFFRVFLIKSLNMPNFFLFVSKMLEDNMSNLHTVVLVW